MPLRIYLSLFAGTLLAAAGQVLFKLGASGREEFTSFLNAWIFSGLLAYGLGTILWIYALSMAKLTVVYPFTALTFVLVYLFGVLVLDEAPNIGAMLGVGFILGGLFLITAYND